MNHKKQNEHYQLTLEWNSSKTNCPAYECVHELFEEQVRKTPDATALIYEKEVLTYTELNNRANQLAHYLCSIGVKKETLVPVCMSRSPEMIIAILGILKAGGAYVPIDPNYPLEKIAYILNDTNAFLVVCNKKSKMQLKGACRSKGAKTPSVISNKKNDLQLGSFKSIELVELNSQASFVKSEPTSNLNIDLTSDNLAYIIYTSGSAGQPKKVMNEHQVLADHCYGLIESANLKNSKSLALFSPLVLDAGHYIIHSSFILGASLQIIPEEIIINSKKIANYIRFRIWPFRMMQSDCKPWGIAAR